MPAITSSTSNLDSVIVPPPTAFKGEQPSSNESVGSDVKLRPQHTVASAENVVVKQVSAQKIALQRKISRQFSKDTEQVEIVETVPSREIVRKISAQMEKHLQTTSNIQRRASRKVARTKSIYRPGTKVTAHAAVRTADPEKNIPPRPAQKITLYSPFKTSTITYNNPSWSFKLCKEVTDLTFVIQIHIYTFSTVFYTIGKVRRSCYDRINILSGKNIHHAL